MDIWVAIRVILRRWYVFVPTLAILLGGTYAVVGSIESRYEARSLLTVLRPGGMTTPEELAEEGTVTAVGRNPYNTPGYGLLTSLAEQAFTGNEVAQRLYDEFGFTDEIDFSVVAGDETPLFTILVEAPTADEAVEGARSATVVLEDVIRDLQLDGGAPPSSLVETQLISEAQVAVEITGSGVRVALALALASFVLAMALTYLVDGLVGARRDGRGVDEDAGAPGLRSANGQRVHDTVEARADDVPMSAAADADGGPGKAGDRRRGRRARRDGG